MDPKNEAAMQALRAAEEVFWINPDLTPFAEADFGSPLNAAMIDDAEARLRRFAPFICARFPETEAAGGLIESELTPIPAMQKALHTAVPGTMLLKRDADLPIAGSIKARGGIYEVLKHTEELALRAGILTKDSDYSELLNHRDFFRGYKIQVGSTGNLGMSIGIMSAAIGYEAIVHMSADARQWKKDLLRSRGVQVVEYEQDYSLAVSEGRKQAENNPYCHFVDDENSKTLFLGYAVAALRLRKQMEELEILPDENRPLFVYLPCGVGGGPGGVAFGLKLVFGDHVHCFFAEPTHAPCMTLGMATGLHNAVSVQDIGIDNKTAADGLAVGRPSGFVGRFMEPFMDGCYTVSDENLYRMLALLGETEELWMEPSALAGMCGPLWLAESSVTDYLERENLSGRMDQAIHIPWGTGGSMVPREDMQAYYRLGKKYLEG